MTAVTDALLASAISDINIRHLLLHRRPESLFAAILRVPFVDLLTTMTQPDLPLTIHEYEEWGDPADPSALHLVSIQRKSLTCTRERPTSAQHDHDCRFAAMP